MTGVELGVEVHQQKFLAEGDTAMHAILKVTASGRPPEVAAVKAAEVLLVDCSSSMRHPHTKIEEAKRAAAAAIDVLPDGVLFAIVRGTETATMVYPREQVLVQASIETRNAARRAIAHLTAYGGTAMGTWLDRARLLFARHQDAVRHAILLTDGNNESETHDALIRSLTACEGQFVCDARGIGDGWIPDQLAEIVRLLRGGADSVVEDHLLAADFRQLVTTAMTRVVPEVRLRIGTMSYTTLRFVKQVRPNEYDLTDRCRDAGERELSLSLGSWSGDESRDYHLCVDIDVAAEPSYDQDRQLAWVAVEPQPVGAEPAPVPILGRWTHDPRIPTELPDDVRVSIVQTELGEALAAGGEAFIAGRTQAAQQAWGTAVRLATELGNHEILCRLDGVVEIIDASAGDVRLRPDVPRSVVLNVVISRASNIWQPDGVAGEAVWGCRLHGVPGQADEPPRTCPHCTEPSPPRAKFCVKCGRPLDEAKG